MKSFILYKDKPLSLELIDFNQNSNFKIDLNEYYSNSMMEIEDFSASPSDSNNFYLSV